MRGLLANGAGIEPPDCTPEGSRSHGSSKQVRCTSLFADCHASVEENIQLSLYPPKVTIVHPANYTATAFYLLMCLRTK